MPSLPPAQTNSIQAQLKKGEITLEVALQHLINDRGEVDLDRLDPELSVRFTRKMRLAGMNNLKTLKPLLPLLLWRNCHYLGCPVAISSEETNQLRDRLATDVQIILVSENSYRNWFRLQNLDQYRMSASATLDPLTGDAESENISQMTELYLSKTDNQIERIKTIIASALRNRASDIHLEPGIEGLRVRYRIDGILRHITTLPPEISRRVIVALKVMSEIDIAESRRPQDGRIGDQYMTANQQEQNLDLRVSTLPCMSGTKGETGEKIVLRLLRQQNSFKTIEDIGFTQPACAIYKNWLQQPQGMIIFTGPTGSGKTSTLYTSLQTIATDSVNIVTVEDPVEYVLPGITQTQVNELAGMTFAAGLRAILRQDPDVIMVGEVRDHETAETAVRAALTGHLVLTTLHTNDAIGAIPRLKDIGPDPGLISDALLGVVAQRLVRRVCPHCAEPYNPTSTDLATLNLSPQEVDLTQWRRGRGCIKCLKTGYLGREAIVELLNVDDKIRQLIYEGTMTQLTQYMHKIDFDSFRTAAIAKLTQGTTTVEEIKRVLPYSALHRRSQ